MDKNRISTAKTKRSEAGRYAVCGLILLVLLIWLLFIAVTLGSVSVSPKEIMGILLRRDTSTAAGQIIWTIRLPRAVSAMLLGGALAAAGFLLQTFFGNPIAGPFVLGISSGAKLVVALTMVFCLYKGILLSSGLLVVSAFAGSMAAMGFILLIAGKVRNMSFLVICGIMIGYICTAATDFVTAFAEDSNIVNLHNWSMGSFSGITWNQTGVMALIILLCYIGLFFMIKPMSAYQLGEAYAMNMGVNLKLFRIELILLSSLLSACVTAFAGPVSFVGIAVPHLVKTMMKTARPIVVLPGCILGGAVFCLMCDTIVRTLFAPTELSISTVTAVFGAPVVIMIMYRRQKGERR